MFAIQISMLTFANKHQTQSQAESDGNVIHFKGVFRKVKEKQRKFKLDDGARKNLKDLQSYYGSSSGNNECVYQISQ